jgi:hypothetical protein
MQIDIELTEQDLKKLVVEELRARLGDKFSLTEKDVAIETKSKQNYKSEWETAAFRAKILVSANV